MLKLRNRSYKGLTLQKIMLISKAQEKHPGQVLAPTTGRKRLRDCFTTQGEWILLWYNTADNSTHIVRDKLN